MLRLGEERRRVESKPFISELSGADLPPRPSHWRELGNFIYFGGVRFFSARRKKGGKQ